MGEGDFHDGLETPSSIGCAGEYLATSILEASEEEPDASYEEDAIFRLDAIIDKAANEVVESNNMLELPLEVFPKNDEDSLLVHAATPASCSRKRTNERHMGTGGVWNPARGADIAKILHTPRRSEDVREYAVKAGYGRMPSHLRQVNAELDAEQQYIGALESPREDPPKAQVRLLRQGEKDVLIAGLKQQFQQATACILKAPKAKGGLKDELEERLGRLRQDIENLSRPYVFVEAEAAR